VFAVCEPDSIPVVYDSWGEWREDRRRILTEPPLPTAPATVAFCALCWGQGRIWSAARNGEGLIPVACGHCQGQGVVHSAC